jgi:hypothetical protein
MLTCASRTENVDSASTKDEERIECVYQHVSFFSDNGTGIDWAKGGLEFWTHINVYTATIMSHLAGS